MTTLNDLQFAQDWDLDSAASGKSEYYVPIMSAPWDMEKLARNIQYWADEFEKDRLAREAARPDLYKKPQREWWK